MVASHGDGEEVVREGVTETPWREQADALSSDGALTRRLRRVARANLRPHQDAEDVLQDVWLKVLRRPPPCREGERVRAYLEQAVRRTAWARRRSSATEQEQEWEEEAELVASRKGRELDSADHAFIAEVREEIDPAVNRMLAAREKSAARRTQRHQVLEILRRRGVISEGDCELLMQHRTNFRIRARTTAVVAPARSIAS